jgi:citronellol/citronellal dehydrogenase
MGIFSNKTVVITGGSRGIGREIALKLASLGANIVLGAKTKEPHKSLEGTILSVAKEVEAAGGKALPYQIDVRDAEQIEGLIKKTLETFKTIDVLINNAGAIYLTDTLHTDAKQFDLMHDVNVRATFLMSRACVPYLKKQGGHILNLSPPITLDTRWLAPHVAYSMSKFGMSMCTKAMAEEFRADKIAVNSLWPRTLIYTAAITRLMGEESLKNCRKPAILADAAAWLLAQDPSEITGQWLLDEEILKKAKISDLAQYNCVDKPDLMPDLYIG